MPNSPHPEGPNKKRHPLTILEAVDHLSNLAELEISSQSALNQKKIQEAFATLNTYLHHLYQKERPQLRDLHVQIGLQAMMQLANEAASQIEKFTEVFKDSTQAGKGIPEYQQLKQFYQSKIVTKLKASEEESNPSTSTILVHTHEIALEKQAIKDLESVRQDRDYELFYLHQGDGMPFFNENLERHIRLVGRFDKSLASSEQEDLFKHMQVALDRDYHVSAAEILKNIDAHLGNFYKEALKYKHNDLIGALNKALMSLMLAANPKNLIHNVTCQKSCLYYFIDFQRYLREALSSDEYFQLLYVELRNDPPFFLHAKKLAHLLSSLLFLRVGAQQGNLELITSLFNKEEIKFSSFTATLSAIDEAIRQNLSHYPSGPLLEILESLDNERKKEEFDPLLQKNAPFQLFSMASATLHTTFIHLPSPTHQEFIDQALIVPEFLGYLRSLDEKKHLLINMQDFTSWKDHARCLALEETSKDKHFEKNLLFMSFPKDTDFYHQQNEYAEIKESTSFKNALQEQIIGGKQCGFYFPANFDPSKEIFPFIDFIHEHFYENKLELSIEERQDFIEIFYFFAFLLIIEKTAPDTVSFTSKDSVDTGSTATASFFGFVSLLGNGSLSADRDFFLLSLYKSAAFVRHRAPFVERIHRALSSLNHFEKVLASKRENLLQACSKLLPELPLHKFFVNKVA